MKITIFDLETSNHDKGNPFDDRNVPVSIAVGTVDFGWDEELHYVDYVNPIEIFYYHFHNEQYRNCSEQYIQEQLTETDLLVGHNVKFDIHWLNRLGWEWYPNLFDTMFPAHINREGIRSSSIALDALSGGDKLPLGTRTVHAGMNPLELPASWIIRYNIQDIFTTYKLFEKQMHEDKYEYLKDM